MEKLSVGKYNITIPKSILENELIKSTIYETADRMVDLNFMYYAIEESIRLFDLPNYSPFEIKNIVLENAGYI